MAEPRPSSDAGNQAARPASPATRPARTPKRPSEPAWRRVPALVNQPGTFIVATVLVVVAVVALVTLGYWNSNIQPGRETAVKAGSKTYDMTYFTRRMKARLNDPVGAGLSGSQLLSLPERLAQEIIEEEVLLQRAGTLGVAVSDSEIDQLMAERLGVPFTTGPDGNVQQSPAFAISVRNRLQASGLSLAEFRRSVHAQQLRTAVRQHFDTEVPVVAPAVLLRQLAVGDKAKAEELKQQIESGADFSALAASTSEDSLTKDRGGLREWAPKGFLPDAFENLAYTLPVGQVSAPFESDGKWVIVRVEERQDSRELTEQERDQAVTKRLVNWLDEQKKAINARHYLDDEGKQAYALEHSGGLDRLANANSRPTLPIPGTGSTP